MSQENKQLLLDKLIGIRERGSNNHAHSPICVLIGNIKLLSIFSDYATKWGNYSKERHYPVSGLVTFRAEYNKGGLWSNHQLTLRMSLLDFVINKLEEELS